VAAFSIRRALLVAAFFFNTYSSAEQNEKYRMQSCRFNLLHLTSRKDSGEKQSAQIQLKAKKLEKKLSV